MLREPLLEALMEEEGCCTAQVLSEDSILKLKKLYTSSIEPWVDSEFYANHNRGRQDSWHISKQIFDIVRADFERVFKEFRFFIAHFSVKRAHSRFNFHLHQDWSIVDETKHKSYQVWIPLNQVSPLNGSIYFLKKSHLILTQPRSKSFGLPIIRMDKDLAGYITQTLLTAGEAVIFHNRTLHGSYPNQCDEDRIGIIINIVEKQAETYYSHWQDGQMVRYSIDGETLVNNLQALEQGILPESLHEIGRESYQLQYLASELKSEHILAMLMQNNIHEHDVCLKKVFKSPAWQYKMDVEGYVVVDAISDTTLKELTELNDAYIENHQPIKEVYFSLKDDLNIRTQVKQKAEKILHADLDKLFENQQYPIFTVLSKKPSADNAFDLHTDTSLLINEQAEAHYGLWIPLQDTDEYNGTLTVIPGSHNWYNWPLANGEKWPFIDYVDYLTKKSIPIRLKRGQILIFDNRLIHGSSANKSEKIRKCIVGRVTPLDTIYYNLYVHEKGFVAYRHRDTPYLDSNWKDITKEEASHAKVFYSDKKLTKHIPLPVIEVSHLSKRFKYRNIDKLALNDMSFKIFEGESIGLIGSNGSGKSTLLSILSGITKPSDGEVKIRGKVVSILDIGSNFHPDLSGLENAKLFLKLYGIPKEKRAQYIAEAMEFSELGDYFYRPIKTYSKGMFLRLSFSVMFKIDADIYLIDEVMSMGDEAFRLKTAKLLDEFKSKQKTLVIASHDKNEIFQYSDECIWIEDGKLQVYGKTEKVFKDYLKFQYSKYYQRNAFTSKETVLLNFENGYQKQFGSDGLGIDTLKLESIHLQSDSGVIKREEDFNIIIKVNGTLVHQASVMIKILNEFKQPVIVSTEIMSSLSQSKSKLQNGWICRLPKEILTSGNYTLNIYFAKYDGGDNLFKERILALEDIIQFSMTGNTEMEIVGTGQHCSVQMPLKWKRF